MDTTAVQQHIEPLASDWERLAQHTKASPFLQPGWIGAWWRAFGRGQLRIITTHRDGRLTGVLPLQRHRGVLSAATNAESPLFGFLAADERAAKQLAHALLSQRARRVELSLMCPDDAGVLLTRTTADAAGYWANTDAVQHSPYIDLGATTWDAYEGRLRKKLRSDHRRRLRRIEEQGRLELEVSDGAKDLHALLEEGFRVEASGWKDAEGTSINARPAARRFYVEVAGWAAERGWLRLAFLRLDGHALAFDFCLECDGIHYLVKTGYDPAHRKFAPGMLLRHMMIARAFAEGLSTYDFLGIPDPYKLEWTSAYQELLTMQMFPPTALGRCNRALFVGGRLASEAARSVARSPHFPEAGLRQLKRAHHAWHGWRNARKVR